MGRVARSSLADRLELAAQGRALGRRAAHAERDPEGGRHADGGRAADRHVADGRRDLARGRGSGGRPPPCGSRRWSIITTASVFPLDGRGPRAPSETAIVIAGGARSSLAGAVGARYNGGGRRMIPVDDALEIVLAHTPAPAGRGSDPAGRRARPRARRGRALRRRTCRPSTARPWTATRCAPPTWPTRPVVLDGGRARSAPASTRTVRCAPGQAMQIMTGAPVPAGATAVQPVEKTRAVDGGRRVEILEPVATGRAHRAPGLARCARATSCSRAGSTIDPATIAVLAAVGKGRVRVGRRPDGRRPRHRRRAGRRLGRARRAAASATATATRWWRRRAGRARRCASLGVVPDQADRIAEAVRAGLRVRRARRLGRRVGGRLRPRRGGAGPLRRRACSSPRWRSSPARPSSSAAAATSSSSACPATPSPPR